MTACSLGYAGRWPAEIWFSTTDYRWRSSCPPHLPTWKPPCGHGAYRWGQRIVLYARDRGSAPGPATGSTAHGRALHYDAHPERFVSKPPDPNAQRLVDQQARRHRGGHSVNTARRCVIQVDKFRSSRPPRRQRCRCHRSCSRPSREQFAKRLPPAGRRPKRSTPALIRSDCDWRRDGPGGRRIRTDESHCPSGRTP